jgi:hypothetical protein
MNFNNQNQIRFNNNQMNYNNNNILTQNMKNGMLTSNDIYTKKDENFNMANNYLNNFNSSNSFNHNYNQNLNNEKAKKNDDPFSNLVSFN